MGRSILTMLLVTILTISRVSNNPTPSACQSLHGSLAWNFHRHASATDVAANAATL